MTATEAIKKLKELSVDKDVDMDVDVEHTHHVADKILCDLLTTLGHSDVVEEYNKVPKWYA